MEHGYDCMSLEEHQNIKQVKLKMVRKYHVTMGGVNGTGCRSGEGPCLKAGNEWTLILYIPAMFYMFIALALVCDEFFVPSLEMFVQYYDIPNDVAGATFMAAGGSMPELFTTLISVFDESAVGFPAIVASAVFNVLFVIAVCALAADEPLELTAWPLARDCSFYLIALGLVVVFLLNDMGTAPAGDAYIKPWEALILFIWYLLYCIFMTVNKTMQRKFNQIFGISPKLNESPDAPDSGAQGVNLKMPSSFRGGIITLLTHHANITETAGIAVVMELKGNLQDAFDEQDHDHDGCITEAEFKDFMNKLGWKPPEDSKDDAIAKVWKMMAKTNDCKLDFSAFKKWYMVSATRVEIEVRRVFDKFDRDGNGTIDTDEVTHLLEHLGHNPTKAEFLRSFADENPGGAKMSMTYEEFEKWYKESMFGEGHRKLHAIEDAADEGFSITWPENPTKVQLFWYFFTYPLCAAMYCSLPDVRRPGMDGKVTWAIIEFALSLVWIAVFSNALYECTVVCSNTIGILPEVAAVTILAAGTSVPDLLSSYIVARKGEGDMAVSSSIGSNLFDVTVGLPVPWMLYSLVNDGKHVTVNRQGLGISIMVLIAMLSFVILVVHCMNWRMTKGMGGLMMVAYFVFLLQYMLQKFPRAPSSPVIDASF